MRKKAVQSETYEQRKASDWKQKSKTTTATTIHTKNIYVTSLNETLISIDLEMNTTFINYTRLLQSSGLFHFLLNSQFVSILITYLHSRSSCEKFRIFLLLFFSFNIPQFNMRILYRMESPKKKSPISPASVTTDNIRFQIPWICFTYIKTVLFTLKEQTELKEEEYWNNRLFVHSEWSNFGHAMPTCSRSIDSLSGSSKKRVIIIPKPWMWFLPDTNHTWIAWNLFHKAEDECICGFNRSLSLSLSSVLLSSFCP